MFRIWVRVWQAFPDTYRTKFVHRMICGILQRQYETSYKPILKCMFSREEVGMLSTVFCYVIERHKRSRYRRSGLNQLHVFEASWPTKHALVIPGKSELSLIKSTVHSVEWSELRHIRTMQDTCLDPSAPSSLFFFIFFTTFTIFCDKTPHWLLSRWNWKNET